MQNITEAAQVLETIISKQPEKLKKTYVCQFSPSLTNAYYNTHYWSIHITGKGTFESRELIKNAGYIWSKYIKAWTHSIDKNDVPSEEIERHKQEEINYYHSRGLTFPYCRPKCSKEGCNGSKISDHQQDYCAECHFKERCERGLDCNGWMGIDCKYNGQTLVGDTVCNSCREDAQDWVEQGVKVCGPGGWFGNDNS